VNVKEYLDLIDDIDVQRERVNSLASELDEERRKLIALERARHELQQRFFAESLQNAIATR
jgi:cell division FtsZ-interacting protein ZapD